MKFVSDRATPIPRSQTDGAGPRRRAGAGRPHPYREDQRAFIYQLKGTPAEYKAGLERAIANGWLWLHESGAYVKFTEAGTAMFA